MNTSSRQETKGNDLGSTSWQHASRFLIALTSTALITGCTGSKLATTKSPDRIYFSHSIASGTDKSRTGDKIDKHSQGLSHTLAELVIHFDNDSAKVRATDLEQLQSFVLGFSREEMPVFLITGHTDSNHSDEYNIGLSDRRAQATQLEMLKMGVPITQTALRGLGESNPVADNQSSDGRQSNRRVSIRAIN